MKSSLTLFAVLFFACFLSVSAGEAPCPKQPACVDYEPASCSPWKFEITIPMWASWIEGGITTETISAGLEYPFDEAIKDLDGIFALNFDAEYKRLGYHFDFLYIAVSPSRNFPGNTPIEQVGVDLAITKLDQYLTYDLIKNNCLTVSVGGGVRYSGTDSTLSVRTGGRAGLTSSAETKLWDAVFAAEAKYCLSDKAFLRFFGDYGGTDSDTTWQILAGGGYFINRCTYLSLDYHHFVQEYTQGGTVIDLTQKGPQLGITYVF